MPYDADVLVVWLVSLAVAVSVAWLALHGWRQGRTLRRWAAGRDLSCRGRGEEDPEVRLAPFRRDDEHLVRELGRVREVVPLERAGRIFRCEERLDLTPWSSGTGPSRTRIAVTFPVPGDDETYSVFDEEGRASADVAPGLRFSRRAVCRKLRSRMPRPPHPLSITLKEGRCLAYLLTPSGAVAEDDLDYLARLERRLSAEEPESGGTPGEPRAADRARRDGEAAEAPAPGPEDADMGRSAGHARREPRASAR